jgi:hypothetical protein
MAAVGGLAGTRLRMRKLENGRAGGWAADIGGMLDAVFRRRDPRIAAKKPQSRALDFIHPYTNTRDLFGQPVPAAELIRRIGKFPWRESLLVLADLGAVIGREQNGRSVQDELVDALLEMTKPEFHSSLQSRRTSIRLVHEQVLSFLAHATILYGGPSVGEIDWDQRPRVPELAVWLVAGNNFLDEWSEPDSRPLTQKEALLASLSRYYRLNNRPDRVSELVRCFWIFGRTPERNKLSAGDEWARLQKTAFGGPFEEYFQANLAPLAIMSTTWGDLRDELRAPPVISRSHFIRQLRSTTSTDHFFRGLTASRETLAPDIRSRLRPDGLPHAPSALYLRPLVELDDDVALAALPCAFQMQLRTGPWARLLHAAKEKYGSSGAQIWLSTFGYFVEQWVRFLAKEAARSPKFHGRVLTSIREGDADEIEDVVILEKKKAILFSVKARLMRDSVAWQGRSRSEVIDWYEEFFFGEAKGGYRDGAVALMSARIDAIRAGKFASQLSSDVQIVPVLVTYDNLCEDYLLYEWLRDKCQERGFLQQHRVGPLTLARVGDFEALMALAAEGTYLGSFLSRREREWANRRLEQMIVEEIGSRQILRPAAIDALWEGLFQSIFARLEGAET